MKLLEHIELVTGADPVGTVIWMHGLGDTGWGHVDVIRALGPLELPPIRYILPHAPIRAVTINNGMQMPAWYDIRMMDDLGRLPDEGGIRESQAAVERLIAREKSRGIAANKIVLAGFSQGGVIALQTGLRHAEQLGAVVAMSTYLSLEDSLDAEGEAANRTTPIYMAHGLQDPVISVNLARQSKEALQRRGYDVAYEEFPMEHSLCGEEIEAVAGLLAQVMDGAPKKSSILLP